MKSKNTAGILALFLGGLGAHKFYLDRPGTGIIYLLFCWTFIPAILGLCEALIFFFFMDDREFNNKYNPLLGVEEIPIRKPVRPENSSISDEIEKLHGLKERGIITEQEFNERKSKLLG